MPRRDRCRLGRRRRVQPVPRELERARLAVEHVARVGGGGPVGGDEERPEAVPVGHQRLVVAEEEAPGEGRQQVVEDWRERPFVAEPPPAARGHRQEGARRQRGGVARAQGAQVVVGHPDVAVVRHRDARGERRGGRVAVDPHRPAPGAAPVGAVHELDLVVPAGGEVRALVGDVQLAGARVDRRERQARAGAQHLGGVVGVDVGHARVRRDDRRPAPGAPAVDRAHHLEAHEHHVVGRGIGVLDRGVEVVERAGARVRDDHVADGLLERCGVHDHLRAAPGPAAVAGGGHQRRAGDEEAAVGSELQAVPDLVRAAAPDRVGGDRVLVVEEGQLGVGDDRGGVAPGPAAVVGGGRDDRVARGVGVEGQRAAVDDAVGSGADPRVGGALVVDAARRATGHRPGDLVEGTPAVGGEAGGDAVRAAVAPAVLLPRADHAVAPVRIAGDRGFHLTAREDAGGVGTPDGAGGVGAGPGDPDRSGPEVFGGRARRARREKGQERDGPHRRQPCRDAHDASFGSMLSPPYEAHRLIETHQIRLRGAMGVPDARRILHAASAKGAGVGCGRREVRVRLTRSGVNPGDVKKRQGWLGAPMPYPRVVPHSDGAGTVDAVGPGVDPARVGRRAWVFGAQSYRPFGTAADATVVPQGLAVDLPDGVGDELGAALGIPGITAHRAVYGDGPVRDRVVLVHGVLGAVGSLAAQLATWGGATVVGTVRRGADLEQAPVPAVALDAPDAAARIRTLAPDGVERIVEVALSANADLDAEIAAQGAVVAAYASPDPRPALPFWPLLFANVTLRLLGSDDLPAEAKAQAARDLTEAAAAGALRVPVAAVYPLEDIAAAHEAVEAGSPTGRILLATGPD